MIVFFRVLLLDLTRIMPLPETMFCAQQIKIPPELPDILKQFTKAAIRTQPCDVLQWSAGYFSALLKGEPLPVKDRVEMPVATQKTDTGLTPGLLKVLHKQLSPKGHVSMKELEKKWKHLCLPVEQLRALLQLDSFGDEVEWMKILALGCSALGGSLLSSLKHACEILTTDLEGGPARVPFDTFSFLYTYLASIDGEIPDSEVDAFLSSIKGSVAHKEGLVGLADFFTPTKKL
ncbi:ropporin-1-like protein isoform X2 [Alligator mississippiensis]|nr:ropporin-1-like protein isoform X2 [Alligator mississippiensis]